MLTLDLHTLPREFSRAAERIARIKKEKEPFFTTYEPDYQQLYELAGKYASITNFLVIGRGGSVTGFKALYAALAKYRTTKRVHIIDTPDPDYVTYVKQRCTPADTLVIITSKSGETIDVIETLLAFQEYRKLVITGGGALKEIADVKELELVTHPPISGRFSFTTPATLLPGALIYVDVKTVVAGMRAVFRQCHPSREISENPALQLATALLLAEEEGFQEVYAPIYRRALAGSTELWTQLMHESVCKEGRGQTFLFQEGPECHHHTNQKLLGGPRRTACLFIMVEQPDKEVRISVDPQVSGVSVRGLPLAALDGEGLGEALAAEYKGVQRSADEARIPNGTIILDVLNPGTFGEITAFWMYVALYSAWLRGLHAFDQPAVERAKELSAEERQQRSPTGKPEKP